VSEAYQARRPYWEQHTPGDGTWHQQWRPDGPPGADLSALRRGLGREPGDVPAMWRFYTTLNRDGHVTAALWAEHAALTLFAIHQQSQRVPMHRAGVGLGTAMLTLRRNQKSSDEAVDRRFAAAATAATRGELTAHLRALVTRLRGIRQGLDYTRLYDDLRGWQFPDSAARTRRRWGAQYFNWKEREPGADPDEPATPVTPAIPGAR
jgi:CRISPR system Cascade subunit CasB